MKEGKRSATPDYWIRVLRVQNFATFVTFKTKLLHTAWTSFTGGGGGAHGVCHVWCVMDRLWRSREESLECLIHTLAANSENKHSFRITKTSCSMIPFAAFICSGLTSDSCNKLNALCTSSSIVCDAKSWTFFVLFFFPLRNALNNDAAIWLGRHYFRASTTSFMLELQHPFLPPPPPRKLSATHRCVVGWMFRVAKSFT